MLDVSRHWFTKEEVLKYPRVNQYDGAKSCAIAASLYGGETGCSYGCLGCGDCVAACQFDA